MTDIFTDDGLNKLSVGQTLTFNTSDGTKTYKIKAIKDGKVLAKEIILYRADEVAFGEEDAKNIFGSWKDKTK